MRRSITRQAIVETASSLFYKNGYNLTGINEIIAEAGIAKATLYSHFKSKDDLCLAYLQHKNVIFLRDIEPFCRSRPRGNQQLSAIFDFLLSFFADRDFNGCWCIKTVSEIPKDNPTIRCEIQRQKEDFMLLIRTLIADNRPEQSPKQTHTLSRQLYLLYESAVTESHLHQDSWPIREAKALSRQILS